MTRIIFTEIKSHHVDAQFLHIANILRIAHPAYFYHHKLVI